MIFPRQVITNVENGRLLGRLPNGEANRTAKPATMGYVALVLICVLVGAAYRLVLFPGAYSPMETDEAGYLSDGLLLVEGETPIHKYAPSGPLTWFSAGYAAIETIRTLAAHSPDIASFPSLLRPAAALESVLFHLYADLSELRLAAVVLVVMLSLAAVAAMGDFGRRAGGVAGGLSAGLIVATLPTFLELTTQARPYSIAWSLALLSIAATAADSERKRTFGAGVLIGLAISSHLDMLRVLPLILLLLWRRSPDGSIPWREFGQTLALAALAFLTTAPWYVLHLVDSLRQILTVRLLGAENIGILSALHTWDQAGIAIPLALTLVGLALASFERRWAEAACGVWLAVNVVLASRPSVHGLHHDGALLVIIAALLPISIAALVRWLAFFRADSWALLLAAIAIASPLWRGGSFAVVAASSTRPHDAIAWIEEHVAPGTDVFMTSNEAKVLLPTTAAAERLWNDVAAPDAWLGKYISDTGRYSVGGARPLRIMAADRMTADRGNRRRFYMLGIPLVPERPRYNLWLVSLGSFFDVTPSAAFERVCGNGGVIFGEIEPARGLPAPTVKWRRPNGVSTYVYKIDAGSCPVSEQAPKDHMQD